jgi:hypothetical protein
VGEGTRESKIDPGGATRFASELQASAPACYVKIQRIWQEHLFDITPDGVRREGFPDGNVEKFIARFKDINAQKARVKK